MHGPLASFSPPAEAVYRGVVTVIPNSFLGARSESWMLGEGQCSCPSQKMLLPGLQRYALRKGTHLGRPKHPIHPFFLVTSTLCAQLKGQGLEVMSVPYIFSAICREIDVDSELQVESEFPSCTYSLYYILICYLEA